MILVAKLEDLNSVTSESNLSIRHPPFLTYFNKYVSLFNMEVGEIFGVNETSWAEAVGKARPIVEYGLIT